MHDQNDDLLSEAFAGFAQAAGPYIRPAGLAPVRATVRRRRATRLAAGTVAAAIAIVAPLAYFTQGDNHHPPVPLNTPTASPSDSLTPSLVPSPSASASGTGGATAPTTISSTPVTCATSNASTAFTPVSLCNATLTMPSTDACAVTKVSFRKGEATVGQYRLSVQRGLLADVDGDGTPDVVAIISCGAGDPVGQEVVAFSRSAGSSAIKTVGLVVGEGSSKGLHGVTDLTADSTGTVRALVDNVSGSDGVAYMAAVKQWRTYKWNGTAFTQTAGHTSFLADTSTAKLDFTASKVTFDPPRDGKQRGLVSVTVHNRGTSTAGPLNVYGLMGQQGPDKNACPLVDGTSATYPLTEVCTLGSLAPGKSRTVTFAFSYEAGYTTLDSDSFVQLRLGDQQYAIITPLHT